MKKRGGLWSAFCLTGIPWFFISLAAFFLVKRWYCANYTRFPFEPESFADIEDLAIYAGLVNVWVLFKNLMWIGTKKRIGLFTWMEKYREEPEEDSLRKKKAQFPQVDGEYLSPRPDQLPLGKQGKMFVQFNIDSCLSLLTVLPLIWTGSTRWRSITTGQVPSFYLTERYFPRRTDFRSS